MTERLHILLQKQLDHALTEEERLELMGLWLDPRYEPALRDWLDTLWNKGDEAWHGLSEQKKKELWEMVAAQPGTPVIEMGPVIRKRWKRWIAAASIILLAGVGGYLLLYNNKTTKPGASIAVTSTEVEAPKITKATIALANGRTISLDSLTTLSQHGVTVIKNDKGEVVYDGSQPAANSPELFYNTLINPRGSQVTGITLSDGSKVWLNAGSSLKYPVVFNGHERKVQITGEAYFEIAHDKTKPFLVSKDNIQVEVLGTHFNVNAYEDEDAIRVTLLEGAVKVTGHEKSLTIKPGEQAVATPYASLAIHHSPDIDQVMAWKNGFFYFTRADVPTIMRQLARWYDLEIAYEGAIPKREFGGEMQRDLPLSSILRLLEKGNIRLRVDGHKLTVLP